MCNEYNIPEGWGPEGLPPLPNERLSGLFKSCALCILNCLLIDIANNLLFLLETV